MKIKISPVILSLFVAAHAQAGKHPITVHHSFSSEIYTEAQPVKAFLDEFDKPLETGDNAFTFNTFELGVKHMGVGVGVQSRFDYVLEFDPDTALYTHLEKNDLPFENRNYRYYLEGKQSTTHGVYISYDIELFKKSLIIAPKVTYFQSTHFQDGVIDGTIYSDEVEGALNVDYYFSKDVLFKEFTPATSPQGKGYSFDLGMSWQATGDLNIHVLAKDLFYEAEYEGSGFVKGFTTDIPFQENEDGTLSTSPTVKLNTSSFDREIMHTLERDARYYVNVDYQYNDRIAFQLASRKYHNDAFHQMSASYGFWDHWKTFAGFETHSKAYLIGVENKYFTLSFKTDNFDFDNANYANLSWSIKKDF